MINNINNNNINQLNTDTNTNTKLNTTSIIRTTTTTSSIINQLIDDYKLRIRIRIHLSSLEEDKMLGANGFKNLKLLPDGAAQFTRGMGMSTVWSSNRGFGERSWCYSKYQQEV